MTTKQIAAKVSEAIRLEQQIEALQIKLDGIKETLLSEAEIKLSEELGGIIPDGSSYNFKDNAGHVARINWPNPSLIRGFWIKSDMAFRLKEKKIIQLGDIKSRAGMHFSKLFRTYHAPVSKIFRDLAPALLGNIQGQALIRMCEEPTSPRVTFETA